MAQDRHFTGAIAARFERRLYGASRGEVRLALVKDTLEREIPCVPGPMLDAGGGLGQMAQWAAGKGHQVTLLEPSEDMLALAAPRLQGQPVRLVKGDVQSIPRLAPGPWPFIVCHAVLEWMADPAAGFAVLADQLAPEGWLSLMVYNGDALRFSNDVKGNFDKVKHNDLAGSGRGTRFTPISPLTHQQITQWCQQLGLSIQGVTGIRVFHDYLRDKFPSDETLAALRELEFRYCRQEPYWRFGRYLLYSLKKSRG